MEDDSDESKQESGIIVHKYTEVVKSSIIELSQNSIVRVKPPCNKFEVFIKKWNKHTEIEQHHLESNQSLNVFGWNENLNSDEEHQVL